MKDLLGRLNIDGFDVARYFDDHSSNSSDLPNIGLAFSGGGYRACLNGAGAVQAFDSRDANSTAGRLGGLLQSATYIAGLSGGSWLVGSIFVSNISVRNPSHLTVAVLQINNFTTISSLLSDSTGNVWEFGSSILDGPKQKEGVLGVLDTATYYQDIYSQVQGKEDAGFNTTITDYWGRALSYQMINATDGGPAFSWSSIRRQPGFSDGEMPLPLVVADSRTPGETLEPGGASLWEFGPFEFGTWDPTTFGFIDLEFLGSNFSDGSLAEDAECVRGFDSASFLMGTSSSLFNLFLLRINSTDIPDSLKSTLGSVLATISQDNEDIASYKPNPFRGYNPTGRSLNADQDSLTLVDGGSDLQNIPLHPLIQPDRHVDVIFAVDSSADTNNWPNGTALVATYERSLNDSGLANHTAFPSIPDQNTFVNLGLNSKPTFFGCDSRNSSGPTPLVVYLPNAPYVYFSNVSTFNPQYNNTERDVIVANGFQVATMGNATVDANWPACVACAILSRSFERTDTDVPDACSECFRSYCWDGTLNSTQPAQYSPATRFTASDVDSAAAFSFYVSRVAVYACFAAGALLLL